MREGNQFSITEIGCGYGELLDFLQQRHCNFKYVGIDIMPMMIAEAKKQHPIGADNFLVGSVPPAKTDYVVASGISNVKGKFEPLEGEAYVKKVLDIMHEYSLKGFAFNMLISYSDADKMRQIVLP